MFKKLASAQSLRFRFIFLEMDSICMCEYICVNMLMLKKLASAENLRFRFIFLETDSVCVCECVCEYVFVNIYA